MKRKELVAIKIIVSLLLLSYFLFLCSWGSYYRRSSKSVSIVTQLCRLGR